MPLDITRDNIRDAASTLSHHWSTRELKDRAGVERLIYAYPCAMRPVICALILRYLEARGGDWSTFESMLFDMAGIVECE